MPNRFKPTAIPLGGYLYQNLVGIELLAAWLGNPSLYQWVQFEADPDEAPKGLDDVVAKRSNGLVDLIQVKFTVDPSNVDNLLTWKWLLTRKQARRSLLQKWAGAYFEFGNASISTAKLITNRIPDRDFLSTLGENGRVRFNSLDDATKLKLEEQIGSSARAAEFLDEFLFEHSYKNFESLQHSVLSQFVPTHCDYSGWHILCNAAKEWALFRDTPRPNGHITLEIIRSTISSKRPAPLNQSFRVPNNYVLPNEDFHASLIERTLRKNSGATVLWGSPGQGKSTYLSYFCRELERNDTPFIRHHYFLHLDDTSDRISLPSIANSLITQIESHHSPFVTNLNANPENLRAYITECGSGYSALGKPFVVVIDGLDHVWREHHKDTRPLESLFAHLLPVPQGVTLIIGTQKVSPEQLPSAFTRLISDDQWIPMPRMTLSAIRNWLIGVMECSSSGPADQNLEKRLSDLAEAFDVISGGHPLHLTYSFEHLKRLHTSFDADDVRALPKCPAGDIRVYYRGLWTQLSQRAKDGLFLVSDAGFLWPDFGIDECLAIPTGSFINETGHLFYISEAGPVPFHGSLVAYVQEQPDFSERIATLIPKVVQWLETQANEYLQWGWLWIYKARLGNMSDLLNGPTRHWLIESMAMGYPESQITQILTAAEQKAFFEKNFPNAIRHRWLKTRMQNGIQFQLDDASRLRKCALSMSTDEYQFRRMSAVLSATTAVDLTELGHYYILHSRIDDAYDCQEELRTRINDRIRANVGTSKDLHRLISHHLGLAANTGRYDHAKLLHNIRNLGYRGRTHFRDFIRVLSRRHDLSLLIPFLQKPLPHGMRIDLEHSIVRLAGACRIHLHDLPEFSRLRKHPIVECWSLLHKGSSTTRVQYSTQFHQFDIENAHGEDDGALERHLHRLFFEALAFNLKNGAHFPTSGQHEFKHRKWLNDGLINIIDVANAIGSIINRGDDVTFAHCFQLASNVSTPEDYRERQDYVAFKNAILEISTDIHLITTIRSRSTITDRQWKQVNSSRCFSYLEWRERYVASGFHLMNRETLEHDIESRIAEESKEVRQFNDKAELFIGLCELAIFEELDSIAQRLLRLSISCVISYGWRKDVSIFHVLQSLSKISKYDVSFVKGQLKRLIPAIDGIEKYTDGDETRHAKFELAEILFSIAPETYVRFYRRLLSTSQWYDAERVLAIALRIIALDEHPFRFLASGLWNKYEIAALMDRESSGDISAKLLLDSELLVLANLRIPPESRRAGNDAKIGTTNMKEITLEPTKFGPNELGALLTEMKSEGVFGGELVRIWFDYWIAHHEEASVLASLKLHIDDTEIYEVIDDVFELSLKLDGEKQAYKWLIKAQVNGHGWSEHWPEERAVKRFEKFGRVYKDKWAQFVIDTSESPFKNSYEDIVIPHARLVDFLIAVDQHGLAKDVCEAMATSILEEVSAQPLQLPVWFDRDGDLS